MMKDLLHTSIVVTLSTSVLLVLFRISEQHSAQTSPGIHSVEQVLDVADQYYADSKKGDDVERFRLKAMTLSLLKYANVSLRSDTLENVAGYSVGRRIKHIEQDLARLRQNIAPVTSPTATSS